jgi:tetratricopeptide (TPR) repeat protein
LKCYNKALEINLKSIDALENKGAHLLKLDREQEAMECFDEVIQITENNVCVWFNRGMVLKNKGKYWEALASFDKGLEFCPDDEDAQQCVDDILKKLIKTEGE